MLQKELADFFISINVRGILTCLGIRRTNSSVDQELPPERQQLMVAFNRLYTLLSEDQLKNNPNPPMLTVGARAMTKHIQRQSGGYWGNFNGLSEKQRNDHANAKMKRILDEVIWINIHTLSATTAQQIILEVRQALGYGARWDVMSEFKGLTEPQLEGSNAKKEKANKSSPN